MICKRIHMYLNKKDTKHNTHEERWNMHEEVYLLFPV